MLCDYTSGGYCSPPQELQASYKTTQFQLIGKLEYHVVRHESYFGVVHFKTPGLWFDSCIDGCHAITLLLLGLMLAHYSLQLM